ncbi:hypothetical protein BDY21DRAFT_281421 [Lineolata rhizophorae]|uniref:Golgi apparatus membrane protein TVP38 n=1 Tax=Lineolata rhizophorae TaxID=578093 RepID=A0A6A6P7W8_9PEZI|nr:hypothetical protein BDY21DRAFT_281421 [Lineolata rhizophorae]
MAPATEDAAARVLAMPVDESPAPASPISPPGWPRHSFNSRRSLNSARPTSLHGRRASLKARVLRSYSRFSRHALRTYERLTPWQRALSVVVGVVTIVLGILFLIYNERIFGMLAPVAQKWRNIRAGWLILWSLIFVVSFPPLIGYSSLLTIAGFVYGFPNGWFIAASATIVGSTCGFLLSRTILKPYVHRLVAHDPRFAALSLTLKHDGLKLLVMIRLCPLPYSLSNGAIATFPTVHPLSFAVATALASPKLMLHIFVGAKMGQIGEAHGAMDARTKALSYASIVISGLAGIVTGWVIYRQTKKRARELEAAERDAVVHATEGDLVREYADDPDALEAAELLREDDDDISLQDAYPDDGVYRDDFEDDADADPVRNVFDAGDGDDDYDVERAEERK